jgi:hypothetical protein
MSTRNKIAHPSADFAWPDSTQVKGYIDFFDALGIALTDVATMYEFSLPQRNATKS